MATLTTLVSFNGTNGNGLTAGLTRDAYGNLFGTTSPTYNQVSGTVQGYGTVFEIAKTATGYASTATTIAVLGGEGESYPSSRLAVDASGNLFGTTYGDGAYDSGTIFEVVRTPGGYSGTAVTLYNFTGANGDGANPVSGLIVDGAGNLLGTTVSGGTDQLGTVFDLARTAGGYASTPTILVSFNGENGATPFGGLSTDAAGNLVGVTANGGQSSAGLPPGAVSGNGAVYQVARTPTGYAASSTVLSRLDVQTGSASSALVRDADGNLFGVSSYGGANGLGTIFEVARTAGGYAATPTVLYTFDQANGGLLTGSLLIDAAGNLFGAASYGGSDEGDHAGVVFELAKVGNGYASSLTALVSFDYVNGSFPGGDIVADADGDLFGTYTAPSGQGAVFRLTDTGYVVACFCRGTRLMTGNGEVAVEGLGIGDTVVNAAGAPVAVRWIGRRSYAGRFLAGQPRLQPVLFRAGSLGDGLPRRDLRVSPEHAMLLDGVLVPARHLVNATTIVQERGLRQVEYFHVELDGHEVLLAEGAPSESFVDDDSRPMFHNADEWDRLYPGRERVPAVFCAPKVEDGAPLDAIRRRLDAVARQVALAA